MMTHIPYVLTGNNTQSERAKTTPATAAKTKGKNDMLIHMLSHPHSIENEMKNLKENSIHGKHRSKYIFDDSILFFFYLFGLHKPDRIKKNI